MDAREGLDGVGAPANACRRINSPADDEKPLQRFGAGCAGGDVGVGDSGAGAFSRAGLLMARRGVVVRAEGATQYL